MSRLVGRLVAAVPGTENGGIAPGDANQGGYHNSRNKLKAIGKGNDYSVRYGPDQSGDGDRFAAFDWTFPDAQRGDYSRIALYTGRVRDAFARKDSRLEGWREVLGQADSDADAEGFDFLFWTTRTPDDSHLWHMHFSALRSYVDVPAIYDNMFDILMGKDGGDVLQDERDRVFNADAYAWKLHDLQSEVPIWIGGKSATLNSKLIPELKELFGNVRTIRDRAASTVDGAEVAAALVADATFMDALADRVADKVADALAARLAE
jgi:hypothetical protein